MTTPDPSLRHGALLAVAEITHALYKQAQSREVTLEEYLRAEVTLALTQLVPRVRLQTHTTLSTIIYLWVGLYMQAIPIHAHNPFAYTCVRTHTHTHTHTQLQAAQVFKGAIGVVMRPAGIHTHSQAKHSLIQHVDDLSSSEVY